MGADLRMLNRVAGQADIYCGISAVLGVWGFRFRGIVGLGLERNVGMKAKVEATTIMLGNCKGEL